MKTIILENEELEILLGEENERLQENEQEEQANLDDQEQEDLDNQQEQQQEDLDDEHEIAVGDDMNEPDPEDDDLEPTGAAEKHKE